MRLRIDDTVLSKSKIREFAALASLLPQFLRQTVERGVELPHDAEGRPVLEYVCANTDQVLIGFRIDPSAQVQVIEGCIPPAYQGRMLDPQASTFSLSKLMATAIPEGLPADRRDELAKHLANRRTDLLQEIRRAIDPDGFFELRLPI